MTTNDNAFPPEEFEIGISKIDVSIVPENLADVLEEIAPQGVSVKMEEIVGKEIVIHSLRFSKSEYGPFAFTIFTDEHGELFNTILGQSVLLPKLYAVRERLPVKAKIVWKPGGSYGGYYDFE